MDTQVDDTKITEISSHLIKYYGLTFSGSRLIDLNNAILQTAEKLNLTHNSLADKILGSISQNEEFNILLDNLQINETYFFREEKILNLLSKIAIPSSNNPACNIWSVGCSTGEEPYSILMFLIESFTSSIQENIDLLATDINLHSMEKALKGKYTPWSFRNTTSERQEKFFKREGDQFQIKENLVQHVKFRVHNLQTDSYPSIVNGTNAKDVILCRNVLIYFDKESRDRIISKLSDCLIPGGYLFLGLTESSFVNNQNLERIIEKDIVYFRRKESSTSTPNKTIRMISKNQGTQFNIPTTQTEDDIFTNSNAHQQNIWQTYYDVGEYEQCINEIIENDSSPVEKFNLDKKKNRVKFEYLINSLVNLNKTKQAIEHCLEHQEVNKESPYFYLLLANLFVHSDNNESAIDNLTKAIYIDKDYIPAHLLLGRIYFSQNEKGLSDNHYRTALALLNKYDDEQIIDSSTGFSAKIIRETILRFLEFNSQ